MSNYKRPNRIWDLSWIKDPEIRTNLERVANMSDSKLQELGSSSWRRNTWLEYALEGIRRHGHEGGCIIWGGPTQRERNGKKRAIFKYEGKVVVAAREGYSLINEFEFPEAQKCLHCCPGQEDPMCIYWKHLYVGTDKDNGADRSKYLQLNSPIYRRVQEIRATYAAASVDQRYGLASALARFYGNTPSRLVISRIIHGAVYKDIPDDFTAVLDLSSLQPFRGEMRDLENSETKMPAKAAKLFKQLYKSDIPNSEKTFLRKFCQKKYGLCHSSMCRISNGHRRLDDDDGDEILTPILITEESLAVLFGPYPCLKR